MYRQFSVESTNEIIEILFGSRQWELTLPTFQLLDALVIKQDD